MSITSKSPRKIALAALRIGEESLSEYAHRFSPQRYTQGQLFACLVLKTFFKTDYRGIAEILEDSPELRQIIGIEKTPHFTTLQKASLRLLRNSKVSELIKSSIFFGASKAS